MIFVLGVLAGIFIAFYLIKKKKIGKKVSLGIIGLQARKKVENKKKILELMKTKNRITNDETEELLGVSDATAERYLDELEKEGWLNQVGAKGRSVYYEPTKGSTR